MTADPLLKQLVYACMHNIHLWHNSEGDIYKDSFAYI